METTTTRQSITFSVLTTIALLALYLFIATRIQAPDDQVTQILLGLFLSVVPAVIWLAFFYQRDHVEPEPKRMVARIYLFGGLAAAAVAVPITALFFEQSVVQLNNVIARLVVTIFSISLVQEVLKLAMVRYVALGTDEFDEHPDGIVYGLAAGLGFATVLNIDFVLRSGGVLPLSAAILATNNAVMHGTLGAFTGYYLGRVKLDGEKVGWLATGLIAATVVNGIYQVASDAVTSIGLSFNPGLSLIVSAVLGLLLSLVLLSIFRQAHSRAAGTLTTISKQAEARSLDMPWDIAPRYDALLLGALALALAVGWGLGLAVKGQTSTFGVTDSPVSLDYPTSWAAEPSVNDLTLTDLSNPDAFKPRFEMLVNKVSPGADLVRLAQERSLTLEQQLDFYQVDTRGQGPVVGDQASQRIRYTYVAQTESGPAVVRGVDTLLFFDDRLYTFRFATERDVFSENFSTYEGILNTVRFQ